MREETIGSLLKVARTNLGLDLNDIVNKLHIKKKYLLALEEGNLDVFPSMVYAYGNMNTYAKFLGLDEAIIKEKSIILPTYSSVWRIPERFIHYNYNKLVAITLSIAMLLLYILASNMFFFEPKNVVDIVQSINLIDSDEIANMHYSMVKSIEMIDDWRNAYSNFLVR